MDNKEITNRIFLAVPVLLVLISVSGCSSIKQKDAQRTADAPTVGAPFSQSNARMADAAVPKTRKWRVFSNRAGWSINYPADWTVSSCHNCTDPTDPDVFVSFFPPQIKDYDEGTVMVEHLADKPQSTGAENWLASIKQTANINPIVMEEKFSLSNLPALKVKYRSSLGTVMQDVYIISGGSTFSIGFSGDKAGAVELENFDNYPLYLKMVATFRMKQ